MFVPTPGKPVHFVDDETGALTVFENIYSDARDIPVLDVEMPRKITALHQIEISSRCNLRCVYCPSPNLARPKVDMSRPHFVRALEMVKYFVDKGTQAELNLAGIGESTIHPDFLEYLALARSIAGPDITITLATNGLTMTDDLARAMAPHRPNVWVSLHRPEKAGPAINALKRAGIRVESSSHPATDGNNWAGQVDWENAQTFATPCQWLRYGLLMAMADGRLTTCCYDASGAGVVGHLSDPAPTLRTRPYSLCGGCHQHIKIKGVEQR